MNSSVVIKSFKNGIRLILDNEIDFEQLMEVVALKFKESSPFFGEATLALQISGRELDDNELKLLLDTISSACNISIPCIISDDDRANIKYVSALEKIDEQLSGKEKVTLIKGSVINNQTINSDDGVVVLGDVNPGCSIVCKGSVIILGGLYGEVICNSELCEADSFIVALEMASEHINICGIDYFPQSKPKWGIKHKIKPEIAYIKNGKIIFDNVSKSSLESLYETI